ncbi:P-loop containing nucleoside triphosphate hydrolase protein [Meira miltonrushii]|uniref:P-loop containing nucleoside triphosphate hydrolase protein n=1 Tax=Meira miltonrushii TaxID=1280837 RepID=A0A316VCE9_9BASI|nr:P-loop containing nucleoside triphosphate hydrolase protein [Meira miltonrushii]PWN35216.1 P-loop containing nucleoside triphosphate hydrolase protein [Meira miltonrushii]
MTSPLPDSQGSSLPATPPTSNDAVKERAYLWSDFILQSPTTKKSTEAQEAIDVDVVENVVEEAEEVVEREQIPAPAPSKSIDWRAPTFISRTQQEKRVQPKASIVQNQDDSSDEDEQHTFRPTASRNWRTPMQYVRKEEEKEESTNSSVFVGHDDTELTRLEDTDGSEVDEEDEEMDEYEMQDYLNYRLKTGLSHLDERLGQEYMHAAQDDEQFDSNQGGLRSGGLIEVSGTPGSGKTTLLMQLAIKERLNSLQQSLSSLHEGEERLNGEACRSDRGRQVVMIDTEGSISARRMAQMTKALITDLLDSWEEQEWSTKPSHDVLFHHTLAGIRIIRCTALFELVATFGVLLPTIDVESIRPDYKDEDEERAKKVKEIDKMMRKKRLPERTSLIIIDSMSHFFRAPTTNERQERSKRQQAIQCARLFASHVHLSGIKLIISTQMSSYFVDVHGDKSNIIKPDNIGFLRPTLRDWMEEDLARSAWHLQLYGAELGSARKIARIISRPHSLLNHDLYGEEYWSAQLPYVIDTRDGIMRSV